MSEPLLIELPPALLEGVIEQVTERVLERLEARLAADEWLDAKRAAAYLSWSIHRLYKHRHELPHVKHGARLMFRRSALDEHLTQFETRPR